ncbi:hypothetical protein ACFUNF_03870 [Streptomyces sp. NPDC057291]|uniref:hypothetical protein n=1 Tax=Streptomyces sp. NPDC057291 TaxID=3346087 RepID=UPI0036381BAC
MESAVSLWTAAHDVDARRPRSLQRQLGASDTVCERRAAYVLFGATPSDWSEKRAAILGTYIHEGLLGAARTEYGWLVEKAVADDTIRGHIDAVQLDQATADRVPARHRPKVPAEHGGDRGGRQDSDAGVPTLKAEIVLPHGQMGSVPASGPCRIGGMSRSGGVGSAILCAWST